MGIFINIGKYPEIFLKNYNGAYKDRIHEFSIGKKGDVIKIMYAFFKNDELIIRDIE